MYKKHVCFLVVTLTCLSACSSMTSKRSGTNILYYTDETNNRIGEQLHETAGTMEWEVTKALDSQSFHEDTLQQFSSIFITFSALNKLNHRAVTSIKRYMEAGGGVAAVKDTLHIQTGWPWLRHWNEITTGKGLEQDNGKLFLLPAGFRTSELQSALTYTIGRNLHLDYRIVTTPAVPEESRYTYKVLTQGMDEPMQMAILPNLDVLFVERKGAVKLYDASERHTRTIARFDVFSGIEEGLLGVALDPNFAKNRWVYFYYAVAGDRAVNRLSRIELHDGRLDKASEKVLLEISTQREYCCHSAGYIRFSPDGLLYLATGDNTNAEDPYEIGYPPLDERPGHELADDQATAANTMDLRGKILRIKPEADGSYSIPEGNLFPEGMPKTLPEIYVMGSRNPFRFSVDMKTKYVYWGDIGPDTKVPGEEGTLSYDEINQAKGPGFFGWPYFLGNNEAFPMYDFATRQEGPPKDPAHPVNDSPNNTGLQLLPSARPAMIWYGVSKSKGYPLVGKGGASAMAGPVYYSDLYPDAEFKLPDYYDGKLFIYDWVRRWFMAVTLDEEGNYQRMEPFLDHLSFIAPIDMQIGQDGAVYILEYGTNWFVKNSDAKLVRIEYAQGNRKPMANIQAETLYGAAPFEARLSAAGSMDYDKNSDLHYLWQVEGKEMEGEQLVYTFDTSGIYDVTLTTIDNHGAENSSTVQVKVGNAPPVINISTHANRSFYWDRKQLDYKVKVYDREDGDIDPDRVNITFDFLPRGEDLAVILADPQSEGDPKFAKGRNLINSLDCKACHPMDRESVGPAYSAIANRYAGEEGVVGKLATKIIEGGSGNWGKRPMPAHPGLSEEDAKEIVEFILSFNDSAESLPVEGSLTLKEHVGQGNEGSYLLMASYTDKGANQIEPLTARTHIALRNPLVQIEDYDEGNIRMGTITTENLTFATNIKHGSFVKFSQIDLTHIRYLTYRIQSQGIGGTIEVRTDSLEGKLVSTIQIPSGTVKDLKTGWREITAPVTGKAVGMHDLFFVFKNPDDLQQNLFNVDWVLFSVSD